jgi:hypothetical protein
MKVLVVQFPLITGGNLEGKFNKNRKLIGIPRIIEQSIFSYGIYVEA